MLDHEIDCVGNCSDILSVRKCRQSRDDDVDPGQPCFSTEPFSLSGGSDDLAVMGRSKHAEQFCQPLAVDIAARKQAVWGRATHDAHPGPDASPSRASSSATPST